MSERAPYSRVYWTIRSDDRLAAVYADDRHLATWLRLLMAADMAWPAPADMPSSVRKSSVQALVDAGVVSLCGGGMFTFHGHDAERGRRRLAATRNRLGQDPDGPAGGPSPSPVAPQPGPKRDPDGRTIPGRSRDEPRRAETTRAIRGTGAPTSTPSWPSGSDPRRPPSGPCSTPTATPST